MQSTRLDTPAAPEPQLPRCFWQPMRTCTPGRDVQLLNPGVRPVYGKWDGKDPQWLGWSPLPELPAEGIAG